MSNEKKRKTPNLYENSAVRTIGEKLYLKDDLADVFFVLKSDDDSSERIPAHKCLLAAVSDVFKAMFYGPLKETGDGKMTDITASAFKEFLQFFYLDQVILTRNNFAMVMKFGQMYNVPECLKVGLDFLRDTLIDEDVFFVYELAVHLDIEEFKEICAKRIVLNIETVLKSDDFLMCKSEVLKHILELKFLPCSETDIFMACISWTKTASQQDKVTKETIQKHLGDLFYAFRFRSMSLEEFVDLIPSFGHLFTIEESNEIIQMIRYKEFKPKMFNGSIREAEWDWDEDAIIECNRFIEESEYVLVSNIERIGFSTNKPILFGEFTCNGLKVWRGNGYHDLKTNLPVKVTIIENNSLGSPPKIISTLNSSLQSTIETVIRLPKPLLIRPGFQYKIELKQAVERHTYKTKSLKPNLVMDKDLQITFHDDTIFDNGKTMRISLIDLLKLRIESTETFGICIENKSIRSGSINNF